MKTQTKTAFISLLIVCLSLCPNFTYAQTQEKNKLVDIFHSLFSETELENTIKLKWKVRSLLSGAEINRTDINSTPTSTPSQTPVTVEFRSDDNSFAIILGSLFGALGGALGICAVVGIVLCVCNRGIANNAPTEPETKADLAV